MTLSLVQAMLYKFGFFRASENLPALLTLFNDFEQIEMNLRILLSILFNIFAIVI